MNTLEQAINYMLHNLKNIKEGEFGELYDLKQHLEPVSVDEFMDPEPDSLDEHEDIPLESLAERRTLLGCYYGMKSPGKVVLFAANLKMFFGSLMLEVLKVTPYITRSDLTAAARLVAFKTWQHELFHFDCNILRIMFGAQKDSLKEEALAVAWSRLKIAEERKAWQSQIGRMSGIVYGILMDRAYRFRSAGYCDWPKYADETRFKAGLLDYIEPQRTRFLTQAGVPVHELLFSLLGKGKDGQGFVEITYP
jgi:hypothetical protein